MKISLAVIIVAMCTSTSSGSWVLDLGKRVIVQLLEWRWDDIAHECEEFLAPKGYAAVMISPPNENLAIPGRPWYERYQAVSYKLVTRSGNQRQLANMISRCNAVGVRIIADTVINHMTGTTNSCVGTAGTRCDDSARSYPGVPYTLADFNRPICSLNNYENATEVRVCELVGLHDLNQTTEHVRERIVKYMNHLVDLGIAGFRIDAAKHMYASDLAIIYSRVKDLSIKHDFEQGTRPFIFQEVVYGGAVTYEEYARIGKVTDFVYGGFVLSIAFLGQEQSYTLSKLLELGPDTKKWDIIPEGESVLFIDNQDLERNGYPYINYKQTRSYKMAIAFLLARGYGTPKVLSSFNYTTPQDGPPCDSRERTLSPRPIRPDGSCSNGWLCQHRWRSVYNMVLFHNVTNGTQLTSWWDNGRNQIAFSMGTKGFIAFNSDNYTLDQVLQTNLPEGKYCDLITGDLVDGSCQGGVLEVRSDGTAQVVISHLDENGVLAVVEGYTAAVGNERSKTNTFGDIL